VTNGSISYVSGSFNYGNTPALRFATGPNSIVIPDTATGNFTFTNSFTMEAVVRSTNNTSTTGAILAKNGTGEGEFWWPFPGLAGGQQRIGMNGQLFLGGTNTLNDGLWHHLPVVYNQAAGQVSLYADYALEASASLTFSNAIGRPADLWIGSFIGGGSDFDGDIDFIRISGGALTPAQFVQTTVALQPIAETLRPAQGLYSDRIAGRDCDHRHSGGDAVARVEPRQNESAGNFLHEQSQANGSGLDYVCSG